MPADVALKFLTNVDALGVYNTVFESRAAMTINDLDLYHLLGEYNMEIPANEENMTLVVAASERCADELLEFLRRSVSQDGYLMAANSTTPLTSMLHAKEIRWRFICGAAKIISVQGFLQKFRCRCPQLHQVPWCCSYGRPDPLMTIFISDTQRFDVDREVVVGHRSTVTYYFTLLGLRVGVRQLDLRAGSLGQPLGYNYRSSMSDINGERMPALAVDGRCQQRLRWDFEGLYRVLDA